MALINFSGVFKNKGKGYGFSVKREDVEKLLRACDSGGGKARLLMFDRTPRPDKDVPGKTYPVFELKIADDSDRPEGLTSGRAYSAPVSSDTDDVSW